jgi:hypothetical protein
MPERLPIHTAKKPEQSVGLQPRQVVVVFDNNSASGATLGYYGTVVEVVSSSVNAHASNPARWKYVINIPFLNDTRVIRGADLIPTDETAAPDIALGPACEVQFDSDASAGHDALSGRYRLAKQTGWTVFRFKRSTCRTPGYRLAIPAAHGNSGSGRLTCYVPMDAELNQAFVLRVLGDVCGRTFLDQ